jgi:hypothetical protein
MRRWKPQGRNLTASACQPRGIGRFDAVFRWRITSVWCRLADLRTVLELALSTCHADFQGFGVEAGHPVPLCSHALTPGAGRFFGGNSRKKREAVFRPELRQGKEIGRVAISVKRRTALRLALPRLRAAARCAPTWGTRSRPNAAAAVKGAGLGVVPSGRISAFTTRRSRDRFQTNCAGMGRS